MKKVFTFFSVSSIIFLSGCVPSSGSGGVNDGYSSGITPNKRTFGEKMGEKMETKVENKFSSLIDKVFDGI